MKKHLAILSLIVSAGMAYGQATVTSSGVIPAASTTIAGVIKPDGKTLTCAAGVCSCVVPSVVLPTGLVTYANGVFSASSAPITTATFSSISLTGGPVYAPGSYLINVGVPAASGGPAPWTLTPSTPTAPAAVGTDYTVSVPAIPAYGVIAVKLPFTRAAGQVISHSVNFTGDPTTAAAGQTAVPAIAVLPAGYDAVRHEVISNSVGTYLYFSSSYGSTFPATAWTVSVK